MRTLLATLLIASTALAGPTVCDAGLCDSLPAVCDGQSHEHQATRGGVVYTCTHMADGPRLDAWVGPNGAAVGDTLSDAPLDLDAPGRALILDQGSITPYRGVLLDEQEDRRRERARVFAETTVRKAEEGVLLPRPAFIAIVLGCAAASAAIAAGMTAWAMKR